MPEIDLKDRMEILPAQQAETPFEHNHVTAPMELVVESVDAAGKPQKLTVYLPNDFDTTKWGILQRAACVKADVKNPWSKETLPTIINAIVYAERNGLSFEDGDVFYVSGRLSKTAQARIKKAMQSGVIKSYAMEVTYGDDIEIQWASFNVRNPIPWKGKDILVKITVQRKDWDVPCPPYETSLREWFEGGNPNWQKRPRYMLEQNALGHALERFAGVGDSVDEAPPLE